LADEEVVTKVAAVVKFLSVRGLKICHGFCGDGFEKQALRIASLLV